MSAFVTPTGKYITSPYIMLNENSAHNLAVVALDMMELEVVYL